MRFGFRVLGTQRRNMTSLSDLERKEKEKKKKGLVIRAGNHDVVGFQVAVQHLHLV